MCDSLASSFSSREVLLPRGLRSWLLNLLVTNMLGGSQGGPIVIEEWRGRVGRRK